MKLKMEELIEKLIHVIMIVLLTIFTNSFFMSKVYFRIRIMEVNDNQENELKKIYKELLLMKL